MPRACRWAGNVRELAHVIARAALLGESERIVDLALPRNTGAIPVTAAAAGGTPEGDGAVVPLKQVERRAIVAGLQACGGDKAQTARARRLAHGSTRR